MNFFFQLVYSQIVNILFNNGTTRMAVIKDLPDNNHTIDLMGMGASIITDETENTPEIENASMSLSIAHFKYANQEDDFLLASCGTDSQQDRRGLYVKQYKSGKVVVLLQAPIYVTTEDAQNDSTLEVGEVYKCNGFIMYKQ